MFVFGWLVVLLFRWFRRLGLRVRVFFCPPLGLGAPLGSPRWCCGRRIPAASFPASVSLYMWWLTGAWKEQGVNAGVFANSLMQQVKAQADASQDTPNPVLLMNNAYLENLNSVDYGSSTCCIATLLPDGSLEV